MELYTIYDETKEKTWALAKRMQQGNQVVYNIQYPESHTPTLVTILYEDGKELNNVVINEKTIEVQGVNFLTFPRKSMATWVLRENTLIPKEVYEGKRGFELNDGIESTFVTGTLEKLYKNGIISGFEKSIEKDFDENPERIEKKMGTQIIRVIKPRENMSFENSEKMRKVGINIAEAIELIRGKNQNETDVETTQRIENFKRAQEIAQTLKQLSKELGIDPKEFLK